MRIQSKNISLMFAMELMGGMLFFLPILALYFEQSLFNTTNVAIIYSVEAIFAAIFEVPSGVIADKIGGKRTMIFAHIILLIGYVFLAIGGSMAFFLAYAIINAFARSLNSGADSAFLYDTLKEEGNEKYFKKIFGTYSAFWPLGASLSSIIGAYLAVINFKLPIILSFFPIAIVVILACFLKQPKYEKSNSKAHHHTIKAFNVLAHSRQLGLLVLAGIFSTMFIYSIDNLDSIYLYFKEIPVYYFGYIGTVKYIFIALGSYSTHWLTSKVGNKAVLVVSSFVMASSFLFSTFSTGVLFLFFWILPVSMYGFKTTITDEIIHKEAPSDIRATVLSINTFLGRISVTVFMPFFGYLADLYSIVTAVQIAASLALLAPITYMLLKKGT